MAGKRAKKGGHDGTGMMRWLLTYADMITILLAFFVVLYSMSQLDRARYARLAQELNSILGSGRSFLAGGTQPLETPADGEGSLPALVEQLRAYLREQGLTDTVPLIRSAQEVVLRFPDTLLFPSGQAELTPRARATLAGLAAILVRFNHPVRVEGFTDDVPIRTALYPSNWHLSAARAATVAEYLVRHGHIQPTRVSATGYGEYRPLYPNDSPRHRALNRRVDLVIVAPAP